MSLFLGLNGWAPRRLPEAGLVLTLLDTCPEYPITQGITLSGVVNTLTVGDSNTVPVSVSVGHVGPLSPFQFTPDPGPGPVVPPVRTGCLPREIRSDPFTCLPSFLPYPDQHPSLRRRHWEFRLYRFVWRSRRFPECSGPTPRPRTSSDVRVLVGPVVTGDVWSEQTYEGSVIASSKTCGSLSPVRCTKVSE